jgi:dTDP-4-amino-4,6-dideoxygalactose transaminase
VAAEIEVGFSRVLERGSFILGEEVAEFERQFSEYCGVGHCIGVANGTDALELSLRGCRVRPGSEVILPANSYVATAEAVVRSGAEPVLVDCDPVYHLIDVDQAAEKIGSSTSALVPVHLYGQMAPVEKLRRIADREGVTIIEDAAQCHGSRRTGCPPGAVGHAAAVSFYPGKNLGACGDAGAVLTDDPALALRVRRARNHGGERRYEHVDLGFNSRMDTLQAVVLIAKLKRLERWNRQRREAALRYDELLSDIAAVQLPQTLEGNEHVWHLYVIRVPRRDRDRVVDKLNSEGIGAAVHYPVPIHLLPAFSNLGHRRGEFPAAEAAANEIVSLPIFPGITPAQQERVVAGVRRVLG